MSKRRTAAQIQRVLREVERDRAKDLTRGDICRKLGFSESTYRRWKRLFDPAVIDDARRVRELESEAERLNRLLGATRVRAGGGSRRGAPTRIRSDNGSEFICAALTGWLAQGGMKAIPIAPASLWENGFIESFHSSLRHGFLEREEFESMSDACSKGTWWRREYKRVRPH